jgi:uncharacterized membrane protein YjjP (DUF1212 family)
LYFVVGVQYVSCRFTYGMSCAAFLRLLGGNSLIFPFDKAPLGIILNLFCSVKNFSSKVNFFNNSNYSVANKISILKGLNIIT